MWATAVNADSFIESIIHYHKISFGCSLHPLLFLQIVLFVCAELSILEFLFYSCPGTQLAQESAIEFLWWAMTRREIGLLGPALIIMSKRLLWFLLSKHSRFPQKGLLHFLPSPDIVISGFPLVAIWPVPLQEELAAQMTLHNFLLHAFLAIFYPAQAPHKHTPALQGPFVTGWHANWSI